MGGEESSTGHQLLSDYIIPDIKTTHTARVPAGGRERRARAELGQPRPQANSYFFIRRPPAAEERRPGARAASGRHPASVSCVAGRPGGCAAGAARAGALARASPQHPEAPRIPGRLPAWRGVALGSGAHSHGPLPALLRRGPGGSGGSAAGPRSSWALRSAEGAAPVSPARQRGPSLARVAALCAPGVSSERSGWRRPRCALDQRAGLGGPARGDPSSSPRSPLPAGCAPDRWRNCTDAPPPPRLLAATLADARAAPDPEGFEWGRDTP